MKYIKYCILTGILGLIVIISVGGCGKYSQDRQLKNIGGIDFSVGTIVSSTDSHGGFHGDGYSLIQAQCNSEDIEQQVNDSDTWRILPLSDNLNTFIYQPVDSKLEIPDIENGFYYFYDRHNDSSDRYSDIDLLSRASFNFTFAIYDSDTGLLYYCEYDT